MAVAVLAVAACDSGGGRSKPEGTGGDGGKVATTIPAPQVTFTPATGQVDVPLNQVVTVAVAKGRLNSVTVHTGPGDKTPIPGEIDPAGTRWTSLPGSVYGPATEYKITATTTGTDGRPAEATSTFTTLKPVKKVTSRVSPLNGSTVGVGHPIALYLSAPVADRTMVEKRLTVITNPPQAGSWKWFTDTQLRWRPAQYWQPNTRVTFDANLAGVDFGGGTWGIESRNITFTIGDSHVSVVDAEAYEMKVFTNGVLERTIPVSLGRPKYPTKSGVHVVMGKERTTIMDSASFGVPAGSSESYSTKVEWATRISNSGEFVHSAPWSLGDQGKRHVSHGCVNVSPAHAKWFFNYSRLGDVVEVKGTPVQIEATNGFGDWNVEFPPPV